MHDVTVFLSHRGDSVESLARPASRALEASVACVPAAATSPAFAASRGASRLSSAQEDRFLEVVTLLGHLETFRRRPRLASVLQRMGLRFDHDASAEPRAASAAEASTRSLDAILRALDEDPLQDGVTHPGEAMLALHIGRYGGRDLLAALAELGPAPGRAAGFLRLLGRSDGLSAEQRRQLVVWGLASPRVEVRDAAIQSVENWADVRLVAILRTHQEQVAWLAKYKDDVILDLEG